MNRDASQDEAFRNVLRLLRRRIVWIVAVVVILVVAAVVYVVLKQPVYEATSQLRFIPQNEQLGGFGIPAPPSGDEAQNAAAQAEIVTSPRVVRAVTKDVGNGRTRSHDGHRSHHGLTRSQVAGSVSTQLNPDTGLIQVTTTADRAPLAAALANSFARHTRDIAQQKQRSRYLSAANQLERQIQGEPAGSVAKTQMEHTVTQWRSFAGFLQPVQITQTAQTPGSPSSPNPVRDIGLAAFLGLIVGILLAFFRDSLDRRLTDAQEIQHELEIPMIGYVEAESLGTLPFARNGSAASGMAMDAFRILRSNIDFLAPDNPPRVIAVTSAVAEEGKSTVAAGLAAAATMAGRSTLLVECDLRRPVFASRMKVASAPGLSDWAVGRAEPQQVLQRVRLQNGAGPSAGTSAGPQTGNADSVAEGAASSTAEHGPSEAHGLVVIAAGSSSPLPAELLGSERFRHFLSQVRSEYDLVVLDCAPLLPVSDALEVLPHVDAIAICARVNQTKREQVRAAKAALEHLPPKPTGLVITGVRASRDGYYYGYYSSRAKRVPEVVVAPVSPPSGGAWR